MSYDKCPNCGALGPRIAGNKIICDYCGSEFEASPNSTGSFESTQSPTDRLFDLSNFRRNDDTATQTLATMLSWINAGCTVESCLSGLEDLAMAHQNDWAMANRNTSLFDKVRMRVIGELSSDEEMLFYKDSGILFMGKTGALITNKNIFVIAKKGVKKLALREIYSIHGLPLIGSLWYFNASRDIEIDAIAASATEQGSIMALVCLLIQREKGSDCKIKVFNGVQ